MMSLYRSQIGANIRNYIELNKDLELMGLGRLSLDSKTPSLDRNQHFIFAGEQSLNLSSGSGEMSPDFTQYLVSVYGVSMEEAENLYRGFVDEVLLEVEAKGRSNVPGLGMFFMENEGIIFEQGRLNLRDEYYGLPSLKIKPINAPQPAVNSDFPTSKKELTPTVNREYGFLMRVAAIALLLILLGSIYDLNRDREQPQEISQLDLKNSRFNQDPTKVLVSEELDGELVQEEEMVEEIASCALIIGSFARESNALELQAKVIEAGFELYTEEFHEFYRVGVAMDCSDVRGASFKEVEKRLGVDPWLRIVR